MDSRAQKKLDYLNETKNLIREAIKAQGQAVADEDTFRSYAEKISAIGGASETILFEEQTIENFAPNANFGNLYNAGIMPPPFRLEIGKKYNVVWDGEEWECSSQDVSAIMPGSVAIGNGSGFGFEGNNEPFAIATNEEALAIFAFDTKTSHTVKIYQKEAVAKVCYVTFMSDDGTTELYKRAVIKDDDCGDPVKRGYISEPVKESTPQYNYTHVGWSATPNGALDENILKSVTTDKTVYANYAAVLRYYTVNFYDGETLLKTESLPYGASSSYIHEKDNHLFKGWNPEPINIFGDMNCYGEWEETYTFAVATWDYIAEKAATGNAADYFSLGDTRTITTKWKDGTSFDLELQIIGFNHDNLADGSGKAGITIATKNAISVYDLTGKASIHDNNANVGWEKSGIRSELKKTFLPNLPAELKEHIKTVVKTAIKAWNNYSEWVNTEDEIFVFSRKEYDGTASTNMWGAHNEGEQYEYYKNSQNRRKYRQSKANGIETAYGKHLTRSRGQNALWSAFVDENGNIVTNATTDIYYAIGFCI